MTKDDQPVRVRQYIEALDAWRGRSLDPDKAVKIANALEPLMAMGKRLGPGSDVIPAAFKGEEDR